LSPGRFLLVSGSNRGGLVIRLPKKTRGNLAGFKLFHLLFQMFFFDRIRAHSCGFFFSPAKNSRVRVRNPRRHWGPPSTPAALPFISLTARNRLGAPRRGTRPLLPRQLLGSGHVFETAPSFALSSVVLRNFAELFSVCSLDSVTHCTPSSLRWAPWLLQPFGRVHSAGLLNLFQLLFFREAPSDQAQGVIFRFCN